MGWSCLEFHTKMNTIDPDTLGSDRASAIGIVEAKDSRRRWSIYNEGEPISRSVPIWASPCSPPMWLSGRWSRTWSRKRPERCIRKLKQAPFPVVAAPSGMALGGGCESLPQFRCHPGPRRDLHRSGGGRVWASIPAWTGSSVLLTRAMDESQENAPAVPCRRSRRCSRPSAWPRSPNRRPRRKGLLILRDGGRHHHEPRSPAGGCQGQGLARPGRGLRAARSRPRSRLPGAECAPCRASGLAVHGPPPLAGKLPPTT